MKLFFNYRYIILNLTVALIFLSLYQTLTKETQTVFENNSKSITIFISSIVMILSETIGLILKIPEIRSHKIATKAINQSFWLLPLYISVSFMISISIIGRLILSGFYSILLLSSYYGLELRDITIGQIFILLEVLRALFVIYVIFWIPSFRKKNKTRPVIINPTLNFTADVLLSIYSAISFTTIWSLLLALIFADINPTEIIYNIYTAIAIFAFVYIPCNLYHFKQHFDQKANESKGQFILYWLSFLLIMAMSLLPILRFG